MMLRAALVGCGKIGSEFADDPRAPGIHSHAGAYAASRRTKLVAVCDQDPNRAERCARRWGLDRYYSSLDRMLAEEDLDIISVCTPDETHAQVLRRILDVGNVRGILAEKPLAMTARDGQDLVRRAKRANVVIAVNYIRRYATTIQRAQRMVSAGGLGDLQALNGTYTKGTLHNGTHWFDLARWMAGDVRRVRAGLGQDDRPTDPTWDVELAFSNGTRGHLQGIDARHYDLFEIDVLGTQGRLRLTESGHAIQVEQVAPSRRYSGYRTLAPKRANARGFRDVLLHAVNDLARCIDSGAQPRCTAADGLAAIRIAQAVQRSSTTGTWVTVTS